MFLMGGPSPLQISLEHATLFTPSKLGLQGGKCCCLVRDLQKYCASTESRRLGAGGPRVCFKISPPNGNLAENTEKNVGAVDGWARGASFAKAGIMADKATNAHTLGACPGQGAFAGYGDWGLGWHSVFQSTSDVLSPIEKRASFGRTIFQLIDTWTLLSCTV